MKKNDTVQIKGLDLLQLRSKAAAVKREIADLILDKNMNKLKDLKMIYKKRKDLAKVLTVIRQKQLLGELESKVTEKGAK